MIITNDIIKEASLGANVTPFFLLDNYPAYMAYSTRKLNSLYEGDCLIVRRSSDSATQSIGFVDNSIDQSALTSFVGGGSGYVTQWFDQTGNGRHAVQSTTGYQPRIVVSGQVHKQKGRPSISFQSTSDQFMLFGNSANISQPLSAFVAMKKNDAEASRHIFDGSARCLLGFTGPLSMYAGSALVTTGKTSTDFQIIAAIFNGANSSLESNTDVPTLGDPGTAYFDANQKLMASVDGAGLTIDGSLSEIIIYSGDKSATKDGIKNIINSYYSVY